MRSELAGEVARFAAGRIDPLRIDDEARIPEELLDELGDLGLFGLSVPERFGGLGLPLWEQCEVVAALAERDRSVATTVGLHAGLGSFAVRALAGEELAAELLPAMARGERIASFCATEAGAGSDLTAVRTTARLEGEEVVLDGEKAYVTNGGFAGVFTVLARSPGVGGRRAHGLVVVPREAPGVQIGAEEHKLGLRGSSTVTVYFEGVRLPRRHLVEAEGRGLQQAHRALTLGRTVMAAGCVGTARTALAMAREHAGRRVQFGRPIERMEAARAHLARMASRLFVMEALVRDVAGRHAGDGTEARLETPSVVAKVFCSEGAHELADRCIQLHGALGFIESTGVPMLARDARITRIFEGANDVLLVRLGAALLASPATHAERLQGIAAHGGSRLQALHRLDAALREACREAARRHGVRIVERQRTLLSLARAHVALAAAGALLRQTSPERHAEPVVEHALWDLCEEAEGALEAARDGEARGELEARLLASPERREDPVEPRTEVHP